MHPLLANLKAKRLKGLLGRQPSAAERWVDWKTVLEADAAPAGSRDGRNLRLLVDREVPAVEAELAAPRIDGKAVSVLTANEYAFLPKAWLGAAA